MASSNADKSSDIFARLRFFQTEDNPDSETRPNPATSRVKRCLFGRGDPEENIRFAKRELEKSLQDSKKRWNFDFESERPLDGRFEWHNPYPRFRPSSSQETSASSAASKENSNPSSNPCSKPSTASESGPSPSSSDSSKANSPKSDAEKPSTAASGAMAKTSTSSSSSSSSSTSSSEHAGSTSQRTTRQSSINRKLSQWLKLSPKVSFFQYLKSSFFVQKFNFDFPRKLSIFWGVKNS